MIPFLPVSVEERRTNANRVWMNDVHKFRRLF